MSDFKTISEVADQLQLPQHVLRFWESQFSQIKPAKRRGGRRFYSAQDLEVIQRIQNFAIRQRLHDQGRQEGAQPKLYAEFKTDYAK